MLNNKVNAFVLRSYSSISGWQWTASRTGKMNAAICVSPVLPARMP